MHGLVMWNSLSEIVFDQADIMGITSMESNFAKWLDNAISLSAEGQSHSCH
jgi:hypothetical protein